MSDTALEAVLRHDRAVVLAALVAITALAWAYLIHLAMPPEAASMSGMAGMNMPGMNIAEMAGPGLAPWGGADFWFMFLMWAVMMVGMMLPSAAPMVLIHARVARQALARGQPFAATAWFASGYLLTWTVFALVATTVQWALESAMLLTPTMASASSGFGACLLIAAGIYQWTPLKRSCLSQCQTPFAFIQRHGGLRREPAGALKLGLRHGFYCIGCCWALMALLFVGGVMNLLWIAGITIFVMIEKIVPTGRWFPRLTGGLLVVLGALLSVSAIAASHLK
jgi:predicted metal-binding membrane protein